MAETPSELELSRLRASFTTSPSDQKTSRVQSTIRTLCLEPHIEGGYFVQTDASQTTLLPDPPHLDIASHGAFPAGGPSGGFALRRLSTTIFYYLTPDRPIGTFHRSRSRIIHTLHRGRGRYVLIHPASGRVETFVVGHDIARGERLQWVVEGGVWKSSFLLDERADSEDTANGGLLISETVVPGFEDADHEFLPLERLRSMFPERAAAELEWLVRKESDNKDADEE